LTIKADQTFADWDSPYTFFAPFYTVRGDEEKRIINGSVGTLLGVW
jgi:hypothetical protein